MTDQSDDLTTAYMAGYEAARDHFRARIEDLRAQLELTRIDADQQRDRANHYEAECRRLQRPVGTLSMEWLDAECRAFARDYDGKDVAQARGLPMWQMPPCSLFCEEWAPPIVAEMAET